MQFQHLSSHERIADWRQRVSLVVRAARTDRLFIAAAETRPHPDHRSLTVLGWQALQNGQTGEAQTLFRAALHHDPYAISAWLGLSRSVDQIDERRSYLQAAIDVHHLLTSIQRHRPDNDIRYSLRERIA